MESSSNVQRLVSLLIALLLAFLLSSVFSPPDPFTQLLHVGVLTVLAYPVAAKVQQWV